MADNPKSPSRLNSAETSDMAKVTFMIVSNESAQAQPLERDVNCNDDIRVS